MRDFDLNRKALELPDYSTENQEGFQTAPDAFSSLDLPQVSVEPSENVEPQTTQTSDTPAPTNATSNSEEDKHGNPSKLWENVPERIDLDERIGVGPIVIKVCSTVLFHLQCAF
jgi:hypothetical protein